MFEIFLFYLHFCTNFVIEKCVHTYHLGAFSRFLCFGDLKLKGIIDKRLFENSN